MKRKLSIKEKELLIQQAADFLGDRGYILFAYVFGSFASGEDFKDIDIGIFVSHDKSESLYLSMELEIERELEDILHVPVDVRVINSAPLSFVYNILKSGKVIVDKDDCLRADFEGLVFKKYFDFKHLRDEYLREIRRD